MIRCQNEIVPRSGDNVNRINGSVIGNNGYDLPFFFFFFASLTHPTNGYPFRAEHGYKIDARAAGFQDIMQGERIVCPALAQFIAVLFSSVRVVQSGAELYISRARRESVTFSSPTRFG